jgi:taurine dioxygenase
MYAAYDELSTPMQEFLEPLSAEYSSDGVARLAIRRIQLLGNDDSEEARTKRERFEAVLQKAQAMAPVRHPLVRVHPVSGRKHLFFSRNAIQRVVDLTESESRSLLEFLFRHVEAMQFQYRNRWKVGKIAMWDERCAQHAVVPDYEGRRIIWRCYVS